MEKESVNLNAEAILLFGREFPESGSLLGKNLFNCAGINISIQPFTTVMTIKEFDDNAVRLPVRTIEFDNDDIEVLVIKKTR